MAFILAASASYCFLLRVQISGEWFSAYKVCFSAQVAWFRYIDIFPQVAWHLLALLAVIAWTAITSILVLLPLLLCGKLRIIDADERTGTDVKKIKEQSYHGSHCCDCKSTDHVPRITVPSSQMYSTIYSSAIAPITESSFDDAVSFPFPSASPPTATELNSYPPSLPEDSLPLDMEEVILF